MRKKEIIPEIKTTTKIKIIKFKSGFPIISFTATAAPVRVFEIKYREINEKPMTKVFVAPRRTRNPFLSVFEMQLPIIAACPEPSPGRKLQIGEAIREPIKGLKIFIFGFDIFCFAIWILFFMLKINIELPNKPVNNGRRG